jgi:hypothetical protein
VATGAAVGQAGDQVPDGALAEVYRQPLEHEQARPADDDNAIAPTFFER